MATDIDPKQLGAALGQRVARVRDALRAELTERLEALADELHAQRAEVAALKMRLAALETEQEKTK